MKEELSNIYITCYAQCHNNPREKQIKVVRDITLSLVTQFGVKPPMSRGSVPEKDIFTNIKLNNYNVILICK